MTHRPGTDSRPLKLKKVERVRIDRSFGLDGESAGVKTAQDRRFDTVEEAKAAALNEVNALPV